LLAAMLVILLIGMMVDALFGVTDRAVRRRWGLAHV
jgi:NitT/TauT family transport system permease protein